MGLGLGASAPASRSAASSRSERASTHRVVVEVGRRGKLVVGEPYFTPGVPIVLDAKGIGDLEPRRPRGRPHRARPRAGRAAASDRPTRIENVLEALLVERGARQPFEPHDPPRSRRRRTASTCATCRPTRSTPTRRRTSTTRSRSAARRTGSARGCTSPTSPTSSAPARRSTTAPRERAFSTYVPGTVAPMLPHELADDLCSLRPHQDRLCVDGRDPAGRRAALLPLGDPLRRAAHLRPGGAPRGAAGDPRAARAERRARAALRERSASRAARCRWRRRRSSSASTGTAASPRRGSRASRTRTCSSRS